jgi:urease accessory protein
MVPFREKRAAASESTLLKFDGSGAQGSPTRGAMTICETGGAASDMPACPAGSGQAHGVPRERDAGVSQGGPDARLLVWLSPSFPVGAFAYRHGLELAAERGWVRDCDGLAAWLSDLATVGSLRNDLILVAAAWRAAAAGDLAALASANSLALALQPSAERRLETVTQGNAFMSTLLAAWPADKLQDVASAMPGDIAYPGAGGAGPAAHAIALDGVLHGFATAFLTNLVSAAIRLSVVGQTDGQRVIASLMPAIAEAAAGASTATLDDLGSATLRSDVASLAHEIQYSRLFRS